MSGPGMDLDDYVNQVRNTIHAAYEAGFSHGEIYTEVESLLFELRSEHDPQIGSADDLSDELDGLVRNAYIETGQVIDVLEEKVEELEQIGGDADSYDDTAELIDADDAAPFNDELSDREGNGEQND